MKNPSLNDQYHQLLSQRPPFGLTHIAFIMDGNGRWAQAQNKPRHYGHREGFKRVKDIAKACRDLKIKCMSLYAFSTENWKRPQAEIDFLFNYLDHFLKKELDSLLNDDCRLVVSGDMLRLPQHSQEALMIALEKTKHCQTYLLNICLNYGSEQEIVRMTKAVAQDVLTKQLKTEDITLDTIRRKLYTAELPPLDLLIRTSGEIRLSNFMLLQLAYSELVFTPTPWPDFKKEQLYECLIDYGQRMRRYGGL